MWVLKGMTDSTGVPPFTIGSRILAPEFSIEDHLSRREKQKQQRMRADLCCVEELSVRLHTASVVVLRAQKSPKGSIDFTAVIWWRRAPIRARRLQTERGEQMTSTIVKHTIEVAGRKTSLSLEDAFWQSLKNMLGTAARRCVIWLLRSILTARMVISRQLCGYLCSTTIRSARTRLYRAR